MFQEEELVLETKLIGVPYRVHEVRDAEEPKLRLEGQVRTRWPVKAIMLRAERNPEEF